jgi:hypothetical protein
MHARRLTPDRLDPMRLLLLRVALLAFVSLVAAAPVACAQDGPGFSSMVEDDLLPTLLKHADTHFRGLRGDLLGAQGADSTWAAAYEPEGPNGPLHGLVSRSASGGLSSYYLILPVSSDAAATLHQMAVGAFATVLDGEFGGLGWARQVQGQPGAARRGVAWMECGGAPAGRAAVVQRRPAAEGEGMEVKLQMMRFDAEACPE